MGTCQILDFTRSEGKPKPDGTRFIPFFFIPTEVLRKNMNYGLNKSFYPVLHRKKSLVVFKMFRSHNQENVIFNSILCCFFSIFSDTSACGISYKYAR